MEFVIGYSFVILLGIFTALLWMIGKRLPKEFALAIVVLMIGGDSILTGLWYFSILDFIDNSKVFRLGIAGAFCTIAFGRAFYFMLAEDKNLLINK